MINLVTHKEIAVDHNVGLLVEGVLKGHKGSIGKSILSGEPKRKTLPTGSRVDRKTNALLWGLPQSGY